MIIGKAERIEISGFSLSTARFEIFGVEQQNKNIEKETLHLYALRILYSRKILLLPHFAIIHYNQTFKR